MQEKQPENPLDTLRVKGKVRNGADGRFYVSVRYREEDNDFGALIAPFTSEENKAAVMDWVEANCVGPAEFHGLNSLVFIEQEDAILFMLLMSR
jgi:hypothetical protein